MQSARTAAVMDTVAGKYWHRHVGRGNTVDHTWYDSASPVTAETVSEPSTPHYLLHTHTHTHTHPFSGPLSVTTQVSRYQKGKTNRDFTGARDSGWQWHQLGHIQVCTLLQTENHASTPPLSFFTGRMPFLLPNQQRQSTEGIFYSIFYNMLQYDIFMLTVESSTCSQRSEK